MSQTLQNFIKKIRSCKTAADERALILKESSQLRELFIVFYRSSVLTLQKPKQNTPARNIIKLIYINMLGYDCEFGKLQCINLMSSQDFAEKKIGYFALNQLFNETTDMLIMATKQIRNDL